MKLLVGVCFAVFCFAVFCFVGLYSLHGLAQTPLTETTQTAPGLILQNLRNSLVQLSSLSTITGDQNTVSVVTGPGTGLECQEKFVQVHKVESQSHDRRTTSRFVFQCGAEQFFFMLERPTGQLALTLLEFLGGVWIDQLAGLTDYYFLWSNGLGSFRRLASGTEDRLSIAFDQFLGFEYLAKTTEQPNQAKERILTFQLVAGGVSVFEMQMIERDFGIGLSERKLFASIANFFYEPDVQGFQSNYNNNFRNYLVMFSPRLSFQNGPPSDESSP
jgi:hypothetical protein